ncbi:MAG: GDSL-type esterase/lipase family protein [Planctomycetota bacterium]|nr:GDSL-type esterase/lipase family protein [Planctomycetota bacterium]
MKRRIALAAVCVMAIPALARAVDVSGKHLSANADFGDAANYRLTGDTIFAYATGNITGDIDLNGFTLVSDTGGGNRRTFSGAIRGKGAFEWLGGGVPQVCPATLAGEKPNTFQGVLTVSRGVLDLAKPAGVDAVPGDLVIGSAGSASIRLVNPNQINDASNVTLGPKGICSLDLQGNNETFATLTITAHAVIDMGGKPATLAVGDSSGRSWDLTKTVTVRNFRPDKDSITFGKNGKALTSGQLARIGFENPAGLARGLYTAQIGSDGRLAPGVLVKPANPPFDVSDDARAQRAKLYEVSGLAGLAGKDTPLKDGMTIGFFGDSITWQNGYVGAIDTAIRAGEGTKGKAVKIVNRGINGADVAGLFKGSAGGGFPGNAPQKSFADCLVADKIDLAVVFIGINDVWWGKGTPETFEKGLRDFVAAAKANKTTLVLATMTVHGELPDGKNGDDPKIERFVEINRRVAKDTGTVLVDLRKAYVAYLQNHNAEVRVDGTMHFVGAGVLTYDGVHPSAKGVALLANLISQGLCEALRK